MSQQPDTGKSRRLATSPKVIVGAVLAVVFAFQNGDTSSVRLYFWEVSAPGWIWLLGLFLVGVAVGSLFPWLRRKR